VQICYTPSLYFFKEYVFTIISMKLYLIPTPLGEGVLYTIPPYTMEVVNQLDTFIVERAKTARHFIKAVNPSRVMQTLTLFELNEHEREEAENGFWTAYNTNKDVGLLSEAGCPGVADPGATIVALAHKKGVEVIPLVGPSSILLALMASGMNGQSFCFHGYLNAKSDQLGKELKQLEQTALRLKQTQLFIETPYRNKNLVETILQTLQPNTQFCIAMDITLPTQYIRTQTVGEWKKTPLPELHKRPALFLLL
jgi:16S rRNA (cytidine1402-2'-O)-methyltransferase